MKDHGLLCFIYNTILGCFIKKFLVDSGKRVKLYAKVLQDFPAVLASVYYCNRVGDLRAKFSDYRDPCSLIR